MAYVELSQEQKLLRALGRPLDPSWVEHFGEIARSILPSSVELQLRNRPGIVYIPGDELSADKMLEAPTAEERRFRLDRYGHLIVDSLAHSGKIDAERTLSAVTVQVNEKFPLRIKNPRIQRAQLVINVEDVPLETEDEGVFHIESERNAAEYQFQIVRERSGERSSPVHNVGIGFVDSSVAREDVAQIGRALAESVTFLGFGALDLGVTSSF
jgi:hypothetical protein